MSDITVTKEAEQFLLQKLEDKPSVVGISLSIKDSGCSQLSYVLGFATEITEDDLVFGDKVKIVISQKNMQYLKGTELDCVTEGLGQMIKFNNPNATNECGCGESFSIK